MRIALHILCVVVVLPYLALAVGFLLLGHAMASGSLLGFVESLLYKAIWLVSWRGLVIVGAVLLVTALGFSARTRWLGAACVCLVAAGCAIVILVIGVDSLSQLLFLAPCVGSAVGAGWLAAEEWPSRRQTEGVA